MLTGNEIVAMYEEAEFYDKRRERLNRAIDSFVKRISFLWKAEPFEFDEAENISKAILLALNERNGNINNEEADKIRAELNEARI